MKNEKVLQPVLAIFSGADERDWEKVRLAMAANVLLDYESLSGNPPAVLESTQIIEAWRGFLPGFDKTHHHLSNFQITEGMGNGYVHCQGKAEHFIGPEVWIVQGTHDAVLSNLNNDWRITELKFNLSKQSGNLNLPAMAVSNLKK